MGRRRANCKKEEGSIMAKQQGDKETKKKRKVGRNVIVDVKVEEEANYKKEQGSITLKQWRDKKVKRKGKCQKKCNSTSMN